MCKCKCMYVCMYVYMYGMFSCTYIFSSIILNYSKLHVLQSIWQSIHPHHHYYTILWYLCRILNTHDIYQNYKNVYTM